MRFLKAQHLRKPYQFAQVRQKGLPINCGPFLLQVIQPGPVSERRLGIIASKKTGNAVTRNRGKRWVREIFRQHQEQLPPSCDVVFVLRAAFVRYPFADLERRFLKACRQFKNNQNCAKPA